MIEKLFFHTLRGVLIFQCALLGDCLAQSAEINVHDIVETPDANSVADLAENKKHDELVSGLIDRLMVENDDKAVEVGLALKSHAKKSDLPKLVKALEGGGSLEAKVTLVEILGQLADDRAVKALRFEIQHGKWPVRLAAIDSLGYIKHGLVVSILSDILSNSSNDEAKLRAASALGRIGNGPARYALQTILKKTKSLGARSAIKWALKRSGKMPDTDRTDSGIARGKKVLAYYRGTPFFFYVPYYRFKYQPSPRLLVCIHDYDLQIENLFNMCQKEALERRMAVLVPYFDNMTYPEYSNFNYRGERTDKRLFEIIEHLRTDIELETREIFFFGYGGGGDFAQRIVMAYPDRVARAAYSLTSFTQADPNLPYPQGVKNNLYAPDVNIDVERFVKSDVSIYVKPDIMSTRQARRFFYLLDEYSARRGITKRFLVKEIGQGDDVQSTFDMSKAYLFAKIAAEKPTYLTPME